VYTLDKGVTQGTFKSPIPPNGLGLPILKFHKNKPDWLIWIGALGCTDSINNCHTEAWYSLDHGLAWKLLDTYVYDIDFAVNGDFTKWNTQGKPIDDQLIFIQSYVKKEGDIRNMSPENTNLKLSWTTDWNLGSNGMDWTVGFAIFDQFMVVALVRIIIKELRILVFF